MTSSRVRPGIPDAAVSAHEDAIDLQDALRSASGLAERRAVALQQIRQLASALSRLADEDPILDEVCRSAQRAAGSVGVVVALTDPKTEHLITRRHTAPDGDRPLFDLHVETGVLADAIRSGETQLVTCGEAGSVEARQAIDATLGDLSGANAVVAVPMMQGRKLRGSILVYALSADAIDAETAEVLGTMGILGGAALSHARLHAESERERRQSDAMADVARAVGESLRVGDVQRLILRHALTLLRGDGACIGLRDGDYLHIESALGIAEVLAGVFVPLHGSLSGWVVEQGTSYISNDVPADPRAYRRNLQLVAVKKAVIVPLVTARGTIGALSVYNRVEDFHEQDARILRRLADQVAVAIVNARLFADVQEATREWSSMFEAIGMGMVVVNDEGRVLRCNTRARQLAGAGAQMALLGRSFYQAILGSDTRPADDPLRSAIEEGVSGRAVWERPATGERFAVHAVAHPDGGAVVTFDTAESTGSTGGTGGTSA
jgi:GAF domain-containing protein